MEVRLNDDILAAAWTAGSQRAFREQALDRLQREIPFDAAIFHSFTPRASLDQAALIGLDRAALGRDAHRWEQHSADLARLRLAADTNGGVAVDTEVFAAKDRANAAYFDGFAKAHNARAVLMGHLKFRDRVTSGVGLLRRKGSAPFTAQEKARLRAALPALSVAEAAHHDGRLVAPTGASGVDVVCSDERLTQRQRDIVSRVAMGQTNAEIAAALGLSPHTVRNILARIFRMIGASNRADLVRLSVLR